MSCLARKWGWSLAGWPPLGTLPGRVVGCRCEGEGTGYRCEGEDGLQVQGRGRVQEAWNSSRCG